MSTSAVPSPFTAQELGSFFTANKMEFVTRARRLSGSSLEAEEVVQDALVRVLLASPELNSVDHARAYFHKVIENLAIDIQRREGRRPKLVVLDDALVEMERLSRHSLDLSDSLAQANDAALIREAIAFLSPAERAALVMWEFEGRSTSEIAKELGVRESTVRHTVSRARTNLRRLLSERVIDPERGLTALDLLSVTFRKATHLVKKSSRTALSLVLVLTAFLGFSSLVPGDFVSDQTETTSTLTIPNDENGVDPQGQDDVVSSEIDSVESQRSSVRKASNVQEFYSSVVSENFEGLDEDGVPTGFTVNDSLGNLGVLFPGQLRVTASETGVLLSNTVSTWSGAANILISQSVVIDSFGTAYAAKVSAGIGGGWQLLNLSFISSQVERLPTGNYLLTAMMVVDSAMETTVKVVTGSSGVDLDSAPGFIATRVLLDAAKSKILAQAVLVSADSQGNGA
jgi:RNA polymerase sigma factor (sigma-70 family)